MRFTIAEKLLVDALFEVAASYKARLPILAHKNLIILLRKRLRMSQQTLAKRANIPQATLSRIESGKVVPNTKTLEKIFEALFCDIALIPLPRQNFDGLVNQRIHYLAEQRVKYLKGTMALELQQPTDIVIKELIAKEEQDIKNKETIDIWSDEGPYA